MTLKKKKESWLVGRRHLSPSTHGDMQRLKRDSPKLESFAPSSCLNRDVAELQRKGGSSSLQPDSCPFPGLMTGKKKAGLTVVFRVGDTSLTTAATSGRVPAPACRLPGPPSPSLPPSSLLPPPPAPWGLAGTRWPETTAEGKQCSAFPGHDLPALAPLATEFGVGASQEMSR